MCCRATAGGWTRWRRPGSGPRCSPTSWVDPAGGGVAIEYGPAMMWNTSYGMHAGAASAAAQIAAADATRLAGQWLREQRRGLSVGDAEEFPGYFTLHTLRDGKITGMMSVNAYTGAVWYHTWHGRYIAMSEQ